MLVGDTPLNDPVTDARAGHPWPLNDWANGMRIVRRYADRMRFDVRMGGFRVDAGNRWSCDANDSKVYQWAADSMRRMLDEARACSDATVGRQLADWAFKSQDRYKLAAAVEMAATQPRHLSARGGVGRSPVFVELHKWGREPMHGDIGQI